MQKSGIFLSFSEILHIIYQNIKKKKLKIKNLAISKEELSSVQN